MIDVRADFPILGVSEAGKRLVYLDSAATTHKPRAVNDAVREYYDNDNANPHRGVYELAQRATDRADMARASAARFFGCDERELVFTRNATESVNLVAYSWALHNIRSGDEVAVYVAEHHSNLVPWQRVARETGARLVYLYPDERGLLTEEELDRKINKNTKLVAVAQVSNVLGLITPVREIVERAHRAGAVVVLDCAQSVPHMPVSFHKLGADFAVMSGHKIYAPMGVGLLYGRHELLDAMPPFLSGGDMIGTVLESGATWAETPRKFEAGTRNVGGEVGLEAAIKYVDGLGWSAIEEHESALMTRCLEGMLSVPNITIYGEARPENRRGVISFNVDEVHPHDVASIMDADGVCIRAGHHCAQPLLDRIGAGRCCRVSFGVYNTMDDVDAFLESLKNVRSWMGFGS